MKTPDVDVPPPARPREIALEHERGVPPAAWQVQCIVREIATGDMPDGTLEQWLAEGWTLVQVVTKDPHEFYYLRRRRRGAETR